VEVTPLALDMVLAIMKMVLVIVTLDGKDVIVINIIPLDVVNFRYSLLLSIFIVYPPFLTYFD